MLSFSTVSAVCIQGVQYLQQQSLNTQLFWEINSNAHNLQNFRGFLRFFRPTTPNQVSRIYHWVSQLMPSEISVIHPCLEFILSVFKNYVFRLAYEVVGFHKTSLYNLSLHSLIHRLLHTRSSFQLKPCPSLYSLYTNVTGVLQFSQTLTL